MKKMLLGLLLALATIIPTHAAVMEYIARNGSDYVIVRPNSPCTNEAILALIPDELKDKFRAGNAHVQGKDYAICFAPYDGRVFVIYEDGDKGMLPMNLFEPLKET